MAIFIRYCIVCYSSFLRSLVRSFADGIRIYTGITADIRALSVLTNEPSNASSLQSERRFTVALPVFFLQLFCKLFHANLFIQHFLAVVGIEEIA